MRRGEGKEERWYGGWEREEEERRVRGGKKGEEVRSKDDKRGKGKR